MDKFDYIKKANEINEVISFEISQYIETNLLNDLTLKQQMCVMYLSNVKQASTSKVADILNMSKSSISQLLRRLESKDYVVRTVNPDNRKEVFVELAEAGKVYSETYTNMIDSLFKKYFSVVTLEEAKYMYELNEKILNHVITEKNKSENI